MTDAPDESANAVTSVQLSTTNASSIFVRILAFLDFGIPVEFQVGMGCGQTVVVHASRGPM
jgi:ribose 1,5-bisphosphokinase PhnN